MPSDAGTSGPLPIDTGAGAVVRLPAPLRRAANRVLGRMPPQLYTVGDQVLLSAASFIAAIVVVRGASVEWFGIYSLLVVVANFFLAILASLIFGQMTLTISTSRPRARAALFRATFFVQILVCAAAAALVLLLCLVPGLAELVRPYRTEVALTVLFTWLLASFDLFKRYLYLNDEQPRSFAYTSGYFVLLMTMLGATLAFAPPERVVAWALASSSAALALGILGNLYCLRALGGARRLGSRGLRRVMSRYLQQGRYSMAGMMVTWVQNQSMTPFLMFTSGPAVVGAFNIARLLVTPVQVINTGVSNGVLPQLRRLVRSDGPAALAARIRSILGTNFLVLVGYFALLGLAWATGLLERAVPAIDTVLPYLAIWIAITVAMLYRTWITIYFIAMNGFALLLRVGLVAAPVTFAGMWLSHLTVDDEHVTMSMILVGELVLIALLVARRRASLRGAPDPDPESGR